MSHIARCLSVVGAPLFAPLVLSLVVLVNISVAAAQVPKETVTGIVNYMPIDKNMSVGGALTGDGIAELKRRGFKAVINLRKPTEPNANVEAEGETVRAAGMKYVSLPFSAGDPYDVAAAQVEPFLKAVNDSDNWPLFIHSAQSHRPTALLVIKRVLQNGWTVEKAYAAQDAQVLADGSAGAKGNKEFAEKYLKAHGK